MFQLPVLIIWPADVRIPLVGNEDLAAVYLVLEYNTGTSQTTILVFV